MGGSPGEGGTLRADGEERRLGVGVEECPASGEVTTSLAVEAGLP